jgi:hypothetical protein
MKKGMYIFYIKYDVFFLARQAMRDVFKKQVTKEGEIKDISPVKVLSTFPEGMMTRGKVLSTFVKRIFLR